jgi:hypothetical protein
LRLRLNEGQGLGAKQFGWRTAEATTSISLLHHHDIVLGSETPRHLVICGEQLH